MTLKSTPGGVNLYLVQGDRNGRDGSAFARPRLSSTPLDVSHEPCESRHIGQGSGCDAVTSMDTVSGSGIWEQLSLFRGGTSGGARPLDLCDYRDWMVSRGLKPNTVQQRMKFARGRLADWGTLHQASHDVALWLGSYSGWTRRTYANHLRSLYAWMLHERLAEESPLEGYRIPGRPIRRPNPLNETDLRAVLDTADGDLYTWLQLGHLQGLRCHEIAKVRGEDVDERGFYVLGKGDVEALLPTHPHVWELAQRYPRTGYWFPSLQQRREYVSESQVTNKVREHFRANGVATGSIHRMRHTYGTTLARNGVPTRILQQLMRHASLNTTEAYVQVLGDELAAGIRTLAA